MSLELANPIAAFFEATNRHDADAVAECFTEHGVVHDENADHGGRAAIRAWADVTYRKYDVTLTPRDARASNQGNVVTTGVAGTFPGSPIELNFRFGLVDDRIANLMIE